MYIIWKHYFDNSSFSIYVDSSVRPHLLCTSINLNGSFIATRMYGALQEMAEIMQTSGPIVRAVAIKNVVVTACMLEIEFVTLSAVFS